MERTVFLHDKVNSFASFIAPGHGRQETVPGSGGPCGRVFKALRPKTRRRLPEPICDPSLSDVRVRNSFLVQHGNFLSI